MSSLIFAALTYATLALAFGWVGILVSAAHLAVLLMGANPPWQWKRYQSRPSDGAGGSGGGTNQYPTPESPVNKGSATDSDSATTAFVVIR